MGFRHTEKSATWVGGYARAEAVATQVPAYKNIVVQRIKGMDVSRSILDQIHESFVRELKKRGGFADVLSKSEELEASEIRDQYSSSLTPKDTLCLLYRVTAYHEPSTLEKLGFGQRNLAMQFMLKEHPEGRSLGEGSVTKETTASFMNLITAFAGSMKTLVDEAAMDVTELISPKRRK